MYKKYLFIVLAVIILALVVFGIYKELGKSKTVLLSEVAEKQKITDVIPVWLRTNSEIQKIQNDLNTITEYRAKYGCATDAPSDVAQCEHYNQRFDQQFALMQDTVHRLNIENKSPAVMAVAIANIKDLAENQSLQIKLVDIKDNPYSSNGKNVDIYRDNKGMEYMVDSATNKVVEFIFSPTPQQDAPYRMTPQISRAQQRQKAEAFLTKHVSDFNQIKNSGNFTYTESSKDNTITAFRWDSNVKLAGGDMVPFTQVVMSPAGDVISFNDTRSLY
jgi:ABC-type antimicrobial peptide transport system permease subunit